MAILRIIGGLLFWAFLLTPSYLVMVESNARSSPKKVKLKRFFTVVTLWFIVPTLGAAVMASLVPPADPPDWVLYAAIGVGILPPWLIAIRLQMKWAREQASSS